MNRDGQPLLYVRQKLSGAECYNLLREKRRLKIYAGCPQASAKTGPERQGLNRRERKIEVGGGELGWRDKNRKRMRRDMI